MFLGAASYINFEWWYTPKNPCSNSYFCPLCFAKKTKLVRFASGFGMQRDGLWPPESFKASSLPYGRSHSGLFKGIFQGLGFYMAEDIKLEHGSRIVSLYIPPLINIAISLNPEPLFSWSLHPKPWFSRTRYVCRKVGYRMYTKTETLKPWTPNSTLNRS